MDEYLKISHTKSELYSSDGKVETFEEGKLSAAAVARNKAIKKALENGFFPSLIDDVRGKGIGDFELDEPHITLLDGMSGSITSEVGRAIVGLTILQLIIKCLDGEQSIRLHKGTTSRGSFSWSEGISMRTLDKNFVTPVLRKYDLLKLNADGFMMTRSLAENYPYTRLYKAAVRGAKPQWVEITDLLEDGSLNPHHALRYFISSLINRSSEFQQLFSDTLAATRSFLDAGRSPAEVFDLLSKFVADADYGARVFEVVLHCAYQALDEMHLVEGHLKPLSQMRSANKKHGNIGDIELLKSSVGMIIEEAWDAKYGKYDLREEVEEISEKLAYHPDCRLAGFITNGDPIISETLQRRMSEVEEFHDCKIEITSFENWYQKIVARFSADEQADFHAKWLLAVVETFGQQRRDKAPIDEPCGLWLETLGEIIRS